MRHLVMPGNLADSSSVVQAVARAAPGATINIMGQYRPAHRDARYPELLDRVTSDRVRALRRYAASLGLTVLEE